MLVALLLPPLPVQPAAAAAAPGLLCVLTVLLPWLHTVLP